MKILIPLSDKDSGINHILMTTVTGLHLWKFHTFEDGFFVDGEQMVVTFGEGLFQTFHHCLHRHEGAYFQ